MPGISNLGEREMIHFRITVHEEFVKCPVRFQEKEGTARRRRRRRRGGGGAEFYDVSVCNSELVKPDEKLAACAFNEDHVSDVVRWLRDAMINSIGIYGMGGIGKTTLLQQVYGHPQFSGKSFSDIALVTVGLHFTVVELQEKIAEGFGLDLRGDRDVNRRAGLLNALLSCKLECILLLDDLWQDFCREDVGIPKHCKLVITSRSLDVCRIMRCQKVFKIEPLPDEKAWQLFSHALGDATSTLQHRIEAENIAKHLCRQCHGVPFAINSLANSLRGDTEISSWKRTLENLTEISTRTTQLKDMLTVLMKSYDNLSSDKVKQCFLLCASNYNGEDMSREEVIRLWIQQGLIDNALSEQVQYDMGHCILNKLQNSCLLDTTDSNNRVKMHEFVKDMGISIIKDHCIGF